MKPRQKRISIIVGGLVVLGLGAALLLNAFNKNLVFFLSPSEALAQHEPTDRTFRIGGMVEQGSLKRDTQSLNIEFRVTDTAKTIPVAYTGILPDLFKEGKGVVAEGKLGTDGVFHASQILAKHDENYMPPEAKHAIEQAKKAQSTLVVN